MRERCEIWDELDTLMGTARTKGERGRRGVAVRELLEAGASVAEVRIAHDYCRKNFSVFTEIALVQHFGRAQHEHANAKPSPLAAVLRMAGREQ